MNDTVEKRENLRKWLKDNNLKAFRAAKDAGIAPSALYNFLNGTTKSLSTDVLAKLAGLKSQPIDAILDPDAYARDKIQVVYLVGARGSMFELDESDRGEIVRPLGIPAGRSIKAARIDGDSLSPIPKDWHVCFEADTTVPEALIGSVAVVRYEGFPRPMIGTVRRGQSEELYTIEAFDGSTVPDVRVRAAHRVVAFTSGKE